MFSPWYAWARRRAPTDPEDHVALNVVLYPTDKTAGRKRWAMTERDRTHLHRTADTLKIGPSQLHWNGQSLTIDIDEITTPIPSRLRGRVTLHPTGIATHVASLDSAGHHRWSPIAPTARVEVALTHPATTWSGPAYFDSNWGDRPLEHDFAGWHWCRAPTPDGTAILYNVTDRAGARSAIALNYAPDGAATPFPAPPEVPLPRTFWRLPRTTGADPGHTACIVQTLEDAPFYARSVVAAHLLGRPVTAMHEQLSLTRFDTHAMRLMLPFKAPRRW